MSDDPAWDAFVAGLDPEDLERERMRPPSPDERPGSLQDLGDRRAHAFIRSEYWRLARGEVTEAERNEFRRRIHARDVAIVDRMIAERDALLNDDDDVDAALDRFNRSRRGTA